MTDPEELAAHVERTHQLARMYKVYLDDAWAYERWDLVAKWAERILKALQENHDPDGPVSVPPQSPLRRRAPSQRVISLE